MPDITRAIIVRIYPEQTLTRADLVRLGEVLVTLHTKEPWIVDIIGEADLLKGLWPMPEGQHPVKIVPFRERQLDLNQQYFTIDQVTPGASKEERAALHEKLADAIGSNVYGIDDERGRRFRVHGEAELGSYGRFALVIDVSGPALISANLTLITYQQAFDIVKAAIPDDLASVVLYTLPD